MPRYLHASAAPGNLPRRAVAGGLALAERLDDAADRAARIVRRVEALPLGATAIVDQVQVRRISLTTYELDHTTIADRADVGAEVLYQAEERLGLDEPPISLAGQYAAAIQTAEIAAGRMLAAHGAEGRYVVTVQRGSLVAEWRGAGARSKALGMFVATLAMRHLEGAVVGYLVQIRVPS